MLTILEIPKQDPPLAAPPPGISPEKLTGGQRRRASSWPKACIAALIPQELSSLLDSFGLHRRPLRQRRSLLRSIVCPSCGGDA